MRRLLVALVLAALATPAEALAEPSGGPYEFAREPVQGLELAPSSNGALASWTAEPWSARTSMAARLLGRSGPLQQRLDFGQVSDGLVGENPRLNQRMKVWAEPTPGAEYGYVLYAQPHTADGIPIGERSTIADSPDEAFFATELVWNQRNRQFLLVYVIAGEPGPFWHAVLLNEQGQSVAQLDIPIRVWGHGGMDGAVRAKDGSYIVVWSDEVDSQEPEFYERQIRGQLYDAAGRKMGPQGFLISDHRNLVGLRRNEDPQVAVDPGSNEAMVVWTDQYEVFGRRVGADGRLIGPDLWLSRMGPPSDPAWLTRSPDVAFSAASAQYLVTWQSGPGRETYPAGEMVYGQHLNRSGGQIGTNDFPIATLDRAVEPAVAAPTGGSDFLVAWSSQRSSPSGWARRVTATTLPAPTAPPEHNPTPDRPPVVQPTPITQPATPIEPPAVNQPSRPSPSPTPGRPPVSTQPPSQRALVVRLRGSRAVGNFAQRGLRVEIQCARACTATATLTVSKKIAKALGSRTRTIARRKARVRQDASAVVRLRPTARLVRKISRRARLDTVLRIETVDADGVVRRSERRVTLRG